MIVEPTEAWIAQAARLLAEGRLVAFPTETVYGLGANAWDAEAVAGIFAAKGRPSHNPLIVHLPDATRLGQVARPLGDEARTALERLAPWMPGPLTVVLPKSDRIPAIVTAGRDTVAVRYPSHPVALRLLRACAFPVAAPSANRSNYVSATCAEDVDEDLGERVALVLDGGPCEHGLESTIVTLAESPPRLLRFGSVPAESIAERLGLAVATLLHSADDAGDTDAGRLAPGNLRVHYSPRTPLVIRRGAEHPVLAGRVGWIAFTAPASDEHARYDPVRVLSIDGDEVDIARRLFATLRELDALGLDAIVIDRCEPSGLGRAIMDRIERAAARHRPAPADSSRFGQEESP